MNKSFNIFGLLIVSLIMSCATSSTNEFSGKTYEYMSWFDGDPSGDFDPYRKILSEKLEEVEDEKADPLNVEKYLDYLALSDAKGVKGVEEKIKAFIAKNPEERRGLFLLGVHYMRNKRKELASYLFNRLEKDPKFPWKSLLYNNLGMLTLQEKDREKAIGYFEKAVNAEPAIPAPRVNLGALYLQSKSYSDALPLFKRALELDGGFEDAALGLGLCYESQGKFNEAHQVYSEFAENHLQAVSVLYNDAIVLGRNLGKKAEASELMLRYIQKGGKESAKAHEMIQGWR